MLHAQVFDLFDNLHEKLYKCHFDNFYMSAKFAYAYFTQHPKKVQAQGVCNVGVQGFSKEVINH